MAVRVLRLMEYVYPDAETAVDDQARWAVQGTVRYGSKLIRSTTLPMTVDSDPVPDWDEGQTPPPGMYQQLGNHRFRPRGDTPTLCSLHCGHPKDDPIHQLQKGEQT